ncbi:MAG: hypothetical protein ACD_7C00511G0013 [uncultured bacterium]|nr:MAG: hypothetical protein ACD_7C00511G0013 [uncultured bacterium]
MLVIFCIGFFVFGFSGRVNANVIMSAQSGDWSSVATWAGGIVPTAGDTVVINGGHIVTISMTTIIPATTVNSGASLILSGGTITLAGDLLFITEGGNTTTFTQMAGTTLDISSYTVGPTYNTYSSTAKMAWSMEGTAGNPAMVTGTTGLITDYHAGSLPKMTVNWQYAVFSGMIHATNCNRINGLGGEIIIEHGLFTNTGSWGFGHGETSQTFSIKNSNFRNITVRNTNNPGYANGYCVTFYHGATLTGTHEVIGNTFANTAGSYFRIYSFGGTDTPGGGVTYTHNVLRCGQWVATSEKGATVDYNLFASIGLDEESYASGVSAKLRNNVYVADANSHGIRLGNPTTPGGAMELSYNAIDDAHYAANPVYLSSKNDTNIHHNIFTGKSSALTLTGAVDTSAPNANIYNNTFANAGPTVAGTNQGMGVMVEGRPGYPYTKVYSNLYYDRLISEGSANSGFTGTGVKANDIAELGYNAYYANGVFGRYDALTFSSWELEANSPTYVAANQFIVSGDQTANYATNSPVKISFASGRTIIDKVLSSSYSSPNTIITTAQSFITAGTITVFYATGTQIPGTGLAGGTDIPGNIDPQFVDNTRNALAWATAHGAAGTDIEKLAWFVDEQLKINGHDANGNPTSPPSWTAEDYRQWIFAGYVPTNPVLSASGLDGAYIGAVQPDVADAIAPTAPTELSVY